MFEVNTNLCTWFQTDCKFYQYNRQAVRIFSDSFRIPSNYNHDTVRVQSILNSITTILHEERSNYTNSFASRCKSRLGTWNDISNTVLST